MSSIWTFNKGILYKKQCSTLLKLEIYFFLLILIKKSCNFVLNYKIIVYFFKYFSVMYSLTCYFRQQNVSKPIFYYSLLTPSPAMKFP